MLWLKGVEELIWAKMPGMYSPARGPAFSDDSELPALGSHHDIAGQEQADVWFRKERAVRQGRIAGSQDDIWNPLLGEAQGDARSERSRDGDPAAQYGSERPRGARRQAVDS